MRRLATAATLVCSAAALAGCGDHAAEGRDCPAAQRDHTLSGFCVPRWVSLKRGEVYGRKGAGKDYPALWVYRVKGLPVQVVAETTDWRRVCDPDGGASWVHRSMIDGRRQVMALAGEAAPLRAAPAEQSAVKAYLNPRSLAAVQRCQAGWCKVKTEGGGGWIEASRVWGASEARQCR